MTAARLVLASASAGRRDVLLRAGVTPQVVVSDVDEPALLEALGPADPAAQVLHLARAKAVDVASRLDAGLAEDPAVIVVGCDSMLDVDGTAVGKPADAAEAKERWQRDMAGRSAVLRTGHWVVHPASGRAVGEVASTTVWHGTPTEAELEAIGALPARSALLLVRSGPTAGARYLLDTDVTTIGRHPEADIFFDDVTVSRRHAVFVRGATGYAVKDVGSLNGTYVNRSSVDSAVLHNGDEVQIGKYRFLYYSR